MVLHQSGMYLGCWKAPTKGYPTVYVSFKCAPLFKMCSQFPESLFPAPCLANREPMKTAINTYDPPLESSGGALSNGMRFDQMRRADNNAQCVSRGNWKAK